MADNNELQTSRIIAAGPASEIDNDFRDLEAALRTIFKITADNDCQEALQILTGPDITMTGTLTLAADPTADLHACSKQYVDNNVGTAALVRCQVVLSSTQVVNAAATDALGWDAANIEEGGDCWAAGAPTRLVAPVAGDYIFGANIMADVASGVPYFTDSVKYNGATWLYTHLGLGAALVNTQNAAVSFAIMENMSASDYIEIFVSPSTVNHTFQANCYAWMMKVG